MQNFKDLVTDKTTLFMAFIGLLLVGFNILLVILQVDTTQTVAITRYNLIASTPFTRGNTPSLYTFALAPAAFYAIQLLLASRMYHKHRNLSILILGLGFIVLLFGIIVSSAIINVNK